MHGDAARERVVDGELPDVGGRVVASPSVHVARQVEVNGVLPHQLLPHVLQLYALQVGRLKAQRELEEGSRGLERSGRRPRLHVPDTQRAGPTPASATKQIKDPICKWPFSSPGGSRLHEEHGDITRQ